MNKTGYVLLNFAAPLAFFFSFHFYGAKTAITIAILTSILQLAFHRVKKIRPSAFFLVSVAFTVGFGGVDLLVRTPRVFKLEPFAQNFVVATAFLVSLLLRVPLLNWFAHALPPPLRPAAPESYLRKLTVVWMLYFYAKAFCFLYLSRRVDLGTLIIVRSVAGSVSFVLLAGGELIFRKVFLKLPHSSQSESVPPAEARP